jgi:hypothetical protein
VYYKSTKNVKANALSKQADFIKKTKHKKTLFKKGANSLKYNSKITIVLKVVKDIAIKQQIREVYKRDIRA